MAVSARDSRQQLALEGEQLAAEAVVRSGMTVLERRFRMRFGEIDIVARQGEFVVFIEVKARRGLRYGRPAEAVTVHKQRRMAQVALAYLVRRRWQEKPCRFDVVEIVARPDAVPQVRHIVDAFRLWTTGEGAPRPGRVVDGPARLR
jgi:putative endonuclease